jgi:hypothetical protein
MSGWFKQKRGYSRIDLGNFSDNAAAVQKWCSSAPTTLLMSVIDRVVGKQ